LRNEFFRSRGKLDDGARSRGSGRSAASSFSGESLKVIERFRFYHHQNPTNMKRTTNEIENGE